MNSAISDSSLLSANSPKTPVVQQAVFVDKIIIDSDVPSYFVILSTKNDIRFLPIFLPDPILDEEYSRFLVASFFDQFPSYPPILFHFPAIAQGCQEEFHL